MRSRTAFVTLLVTHAALAAQDPEHARTGLFNRALGVECAHCHTPDDWARSDKPPFDYARRMTRMVEGLNLGPMKPFGGVTCWTCHRGQSRPARLPRESWEAISKEWAPVFQGPHQNRALAMSVYAASLGVTCTHCHVQDAWDDDTKPAKPIVATMGEVFKVIPPYFEGVRAPVTQCFMCHQGSIKPPR